MIAPNVVPWMVHAVFPTFVRFLLKLMESFHGEVSLLDSDLGDEDPSQFVPVMQQTEQHGCVGLVVDQQTCPEPMVSRKVYLRVFYELQEERILFLKETLLLRQKLDRAARRQRDDDFSPNATLNQLTLKGLDGVAEPTRCAQLVAIDEISQALQHAETIELLKQAHQVKLEDLKADHRKEIEELQRKHDQSLHTMREAVRKQDGVTATLRRTMEMEKLRYRQRAEQSAEAAIDEVKHENAKLNKQLLKLQQLLDAEREVNHNHESQDVRQSQIISQLQQQVTTLTQERGELKSALIHMNREHTQLQERFKAQQKVIQTLESHPSADASAEGSRRGTVQKFPAPQSPNEGKHRLSEAFLRRISRSVAAAAE